MFTFKYQPKKDTPYRRVIVPSEFIRVGETKSYFYVQVETYPSYQYTNLVFWSYESPIACVSINRAYETETTHDFDLMLTVAVNDRLWNVSRTTVRQFKRFLRIVALNEGLGDSFPNTVVEMLRRSDHYVQHEFPDVADVRACPHSCDVWTIRCEPSRIWDELAAIDAPQPKSCWI